MYFSVCMYSINPWNMIGTLPEVLGTQDKELKNLSKEDSLTAGALASLSPAGQRVWDASVGDPVAPRRSGTRAILRKAGASGVQALALVQAVNSGSATTALLSGAVAAAPGGVHLRGLMGCWPVFMELVRECHPRDPSAAWALLHVAHDAFDRGYNTPDISVPVAVTDLLAGWRFADQGIVSEMVDGEQDDSACRRGTLLCAPHAGAFQFMDVVVAQAAASEAAGWSTRGTCSRAGRYDRARTRGGG